MTQAEQKIVQYLNEAHGMEEALVRVLQSQIAMTPQGSYRNSLESHLQETYNHAERVQRRLAQLGQGGNPLQLGVGLVQSVLGQALALGKTPLDLLRGTGKNEKALKNAKDACATEALEIATYTAIGHLAVSLGDEETATLAASIRVDEQRMLDRLTGELPGLTDAVLAETPGAPRRRASRSGSTRAARNGSKPSRKPARRTSAAAKRSAGESRKRSDAERKLAGTRG